MTCSSDATGRTLLLSLVTRIKGQAEQMEQSVDKRTITDHCEVVHVHQGTGPVRVFKWFLSTFKHIECELSLKSIFSNPNSTMRAASGVTTFLEADPEQRAPVQPVTI